MSYIRDGLVTPDADVKYLHNGQFAWGWIENEDHPQEFERWDSENDRDAFVDLLLDRAFVIDQHMGHHECGLCGLDNYWFNGIIKFGYKGMEYVSPSGVLHYIVHHNYRPSDMVMEAVEHGEIITTWNQMFDKPFGKYGKLMLDECEKKKD